MPQLVYVTNIQKFCTHDGPGIRTNVFFKGCSMECKWCANPETIDPYPQLMYYRNKCTGCGRCIPDCIHEAIKFHHDGSRVEQIPGKCKNCGACVSACRQEAREIIGELKKRFPAGKVFMEKQINASLAVHTGPGLVGILLFQPTA